MKAELTYDIAKYYLENTIFKEYASQEFYVEQNKWTYWAHGYLHHVTEPSEYEEEGNERHGKNTISNDDAFEQWKREAIKAENAVNRKFEGYTMKQSQYDALCLLAIDCGTITDDLAESVKTNPEGKATETIFKGYMTDGTPECETWRESVWNIYAEMSGSDVEVSGPATETNPPFLRKGPWALYSAGMIGVFGGGMSSSSSSSQNPPAPAASTSSSVPSIPKPSQSSTSPSASSQLSSTSSQTTASTTSSQSSEEEEEDACPATSKAIDNLMDSMCGGISIPGLNIDAILNKMVEKSPLVSAAIKSLKQAKQKAEERKAKAEAKYDENDPEDKKELDAVKEEINAELKQIEEDMKKVIDDFKKEFKPMVKQRINTIKMSFVSLKESISDLTATVTAALSSIPLPSFIGTGSPNPAKPVAEFITIKHQLNAQLNTVMAKAIDLCNAAQDILFDLPAPVLGVLEGLAPLKQLIGSIPG